MARRPPRRPAGWHYYATGSRSKAFLWSLLSGLTEPIGAGLGWLALHSVMDDNVMGGLFGAVAGMMVSICMQDLLPTAVRYDPADAVGSNACIAGMAVMAASLVLFQFA